MVRVSRVDRIDIFLSIHAHDDNIIDGIPSQVKKKYG